MDDIGRFWNKKRWYSYCSAHQIYNKDCKICNGGHYVNIWKLKTNGLIHNISPRVWMWFNNK